MTEHLQPHWLFVDDNRFESGIERALRIHEPTEVTMIGEHEKFVLVAF